MASVEGGRRSSISIYDYPEHLNPFSEDDNHSRLRFWTLGRKKGRSSSFSFSNLKDFRNTWNFGSFRKKQRTASTGNSSSLSCISNQNSPETDRKPYSNVSANNTPTMFRNSCSSQSQGYSGNTLRTPLPRSRFHERVSHLDINRTSESIKTNNDDSSSYGDEVFINDNLDRSERGSCSSLRSTPFDEPGDGSIRSSSRKKRRAPLPPVSTNISTMPSIPSIIVTQDISIKATKDHSSLIQRKSTKIDLIKDIDIDDPSFKTELKIIEDDDIETNNNNPKTIKDTSTEKSDISIETTNEIHETVEKIHELVLTEETDSKRDVDVKKVNGVQKPKEDSETAVFKKIDITAYQKQQSLTENETTVQKVDTDNLDCPRTTTDSIVEKHSHNTNTQSDFEGAKLQNTINRDFDTINRDMEVITGAVSIQDVDVGNRHSVSNIRKKFEFPENHQYDMSPNPIPKPRRTRGFTRSTSSESSKSSVTTPIDENISLKIV